MAIIACIGYRNIPAIEEYDPRTTRQVEEHNRVIVENAKILVMIAEKAAHRQGLPGQLLSGR
ncbi:MAG TPA: hypothetical protein VLM75_04275 [Spirochaetota bacterium]|nr:hypothetical protein [Spirochaetota bacterium]